MHERLGSSAGVWVDLQRVHRSLGPNAGEESTSDFSVAVFGPSLALANEVFSLTEQGYQRKRIQMQTDSTHNTMLSVWARQSVNDGKRGKAVFTSSRFELSAI